MDSFIQSNPRVSETVTQVKHECPWNTQFGVGDLGDEISKYDRELTDVDAFTGVAKISG